MIKSFDFYFDFVSPYSFLAHKEIIKIEKKNSVKINAIITKNLGTMYLCESLEIQAPKNKLIAKK